MKIEERYEKCSQLLQKYKQQHLLTFWDELDDSGKDRLLKQIQEFDFELLDEKIHRYVKNSSVKLPTNIEPVPEYPALPQNSEQKEKYIKAKRLGTELLSKGKVAAFVVAGGQGTRLGFDGPKGDFKISPVKNKTLFQLFAETIKAAGEKYGFEPRWYVMTSPLNHEPTRKIFRDNNFYGLKEQNVFIFQQGTEVNFSSDGKILLEEKDAIAMSPDGHGGSLKALYKNSAVADMKARGIEYISYFQVDNPLINIFDPLFIGLHVMDKAEMSSKALTKAGPFEKVGNFCQINGKVTVIEYSDLPGELAEKKNKDDSLVFSLGSIAIHIINRSFVEKLNTAGFTLPYHKAVKKISYMDLQNGQKIEPQKPNGIKLETFVFDALPFAEKSIILETIRSEEFAPVKEDESQGPDNTVVAKKMMIARWASWLEQAGVEIPKKPDSSIDCKIEIAPAFAICRQDIEKKKDKIPQIKPGDTICLE
ncbi:MAG: UDPGP type 1 family protein [Planctomycetes bacterium]|nr:UDPGP type 1 family protein [Planctomycetota bacterium]MBU1518193.1 UDPGP type 1 family protein [Planctomycetota bacterium]MBU2458680.1 UDPGP type 1 family protein [Planctomycetota bacterium]